MKAPNPSDRPPAATAAPRLGPEAALHWQAQTFLANRDAIIVSDLYGRVLDWNPAAERIFGYTRDEMLGQPTATLHQPEDAPTLSQSIRDGLTRDGCWAGEIVYRRKDGSTGICETTVSPLLDEHGQIVGAFGVNRDITERKRLEAEHSAALAEARAAHHAAEVALADQVRAREAITASEEAAKRHAAEVEAVLDLIADAVFIYDDEGRIVRSNAAARTLFGVAPPADYETQSPQERTDFARPSDAHGQPIPAEESGLYRLLRGEELTGANTIDVRLYPPNGRELQVNISGAPLRDASGAIVGAVAVSRDVTERRRLEHAEAERARELHAIFAAMADGVAIYDTTGRLVQWNAALATLFEFERQPDYATLPLGERPGRMHTREASGEAIPPGDLPFMRAMRGEILTGARAVDFLATLPSGRVAEIGASAAPLRDDAGAVVGAVTVYRDVTERRRAEEALRASEAELAVELADMRQLERISARMIGEGDLDALYDQIVGAAIALMRSDMGSMQTYHQDQNALHLLAYRDFDPASAAFWEWVRVDSGSSCSAALVSGTRVTVPDIETCDFMAGTEDLQFYRLSGIKAVQSTPLIARNGRVVGMISTHWRVPHQPGDRELRLFDMLARQAADLIERAQTKEVLRAANDALAAANQTKDEFLGVASHELRTPLTSISMNTQLANKYLRGLSHAAAVTGDATLRSRVERTELLLERSERQLARMNRLVGDLLDVSRIQAGKLEMRPEVCDLLAIVREAVEEQRAAWPERSITCTPPRRRAATLPSATLPSAMLPIVADADRIGQVVTNYLTNALKYSAKDRPVAVRVRVVSGGEHERARVEVSDHGPGLTSEQRAQLFERFYRVPGIEQQSGSGIGLGLGLHICQTMIERHGGQVGVESVPGEGSTFWFTLPLATPLTPLATSADADERA